MTLSLPHGVERALASGRLPADAEAWHSGLQLWIRVSRHPEVAGLMHTAEMAMFEMPDPDLDLFSLPPIPAVLPESAEPVVEEPITLSAVVGQPDPSQLPLIPLENVEPHFEFSQFLQRSSAAEERRQAVRSSGGVRASGPLRVVVAGAEEIRNGQRRLRRLLAQYQVPGWAAVLTVLLLGTSAAGLFFLGRATAPGSTLPVPITVTNALPANWAWPGDSIVDAAVLAIPNPLALEEQELENNLRLSESVVWQPAIDFASAEQRSRSSRKLDAVRNSISLYRIAAWRQIDSASRDSDPRLEPFEESTRIDEVLKLMQSAVMLLDSLAPTFRVNGELLVFNNEVPASRYSWLRRRADSLVLAPVSGDTLLGVPRGPRRVVSRLLETMPHAITAEVPR
jgi:hypothetical protein